MASLKLTAVLHKMRRVLAACFAIAALLALASCGEPDDSAGERYPVSGTVTYNGIPLDEGVICFLTDDPSDPGTSSPIKNGSYNLITAGAKPGARARNYKVTVTAKVNVYDRAREEFQKKTGADESSPIPPEYIEKAVAEGKSPIPLGYTNPRTTNLTAEVKPETNTLDFALSDSTAPRNPPAIAQKPKSPLRPKPKR